MSYHDLSECTLTGEERAAEKDRILSRLMGIQDELNLKELSFVTSMESSSWCSVKQLFYLRDISDKY